MIDDRTAVLAADLNTPPDTSCTLACGSHAPTETLTTQLCVVGGGMAGVCAAISAARMGIHTVLVQDRPVLGGNASSEVRMWICGAHGRDNKETGILEELQLANLRFNPTLRYSVWDSVLYAAVRAEPHLTLLLNCAVCEVRMHDAQRIAAVRAWHLTRQCWIDVQAEGFIDCSGDSILRLSGAPCRWGREAQACSGESLARPTADRRTMGNTILIQLREIDPRDHRPYIPPPYALTVDAATFPHREKNMRPTGHNFWWLELGGMDDTIVDADRLRDRLAALATGVWAYIKNHPDGRGHRWELEWVGALPGKRENVRYEGDHILCQQDIEAQGKFHDLVAHGGWTMDDHPPGGIEHRGVDTTHHPAPSPYGIPYRCLYSRTVGNLWFAGRNISATHLAMSSTRVMATCATMGQAAGTAAALAILHHCDNRTVGQTWLSQLQRRLMDQDQWLPGRRRPIAPLSLPTVATFIAHRAPATAGALESAASPPGNTGFVRAPMDGDGSLAEPPVDAAAGVDILRNGLDRLAAEVSNRWDAYPGDAIEVRWQARVQVGRLRLVGDSELHRTKRMPCSYPLSGHVQTMPAPLPRDLRIETQLADGSWQTVATVRDNLRRCLIVEWSPPTDTRAMRVVFERGWSSDRAGITVDHPADGGRMGIFALEFGEPQTDGAIDLIDFPPPYQRQRLSAARA